MTFVKSWDTSVPVGRSSAQLEVILRRYGARGYTVSNNYEQRTILIGFTLSKSVMPKADNSLDIRLAISFGEVLRRLDKMSDFSALRRRRSTDTWAIEQAERVAWRHIILFVEAGLNAATAGIQSLEEAFFAHTVLEGTGQRVIDVVHEHRKQLTAGKAQS